MHQKVLIFDFGSQYTQLIARRVRELNVFCEIYPYNHLSVSFDQYQAVILSGSPFSVHDQNAPQIDLTFTKSIPTLGICYGAQYIAHRLGGKITASKHREYGHSKLHTQNSKELFFKQVPDSSQAWMSHGDTIIDLPKNSKKIASTDSIENAGYKIEPHIYGIQFHPEVYHSTYGKQVLHNFLIDIAGIKPTWTSDSFIDMSIKEIKSKVGMDKVVLGLSGGVDSAVAAYLLNRAIGNQLYCIFVDNGLLRKDEFHQVLAQFQNLGLQIKGVDAAKVFLKNLKGITDPEEKRKVIGNTFVEIFDQQASSIDNVKWLAQGTIYPDVIESVSVTGPSVTIKSHHNVGGLPDLMKLKVIEPLRMLFKDEVRKVGRALKLPNQILQRHPFPGPGLGIRILGQVTMEKIKLLQQADSIFIEQLKAHGYYNKTWQAFVVLLPIKTVGVMGDERTYEHCVSLRAVHSTDGMTADWADFSHEFLKNTANQIINKVKGINRVVYDISSKPPATIEWE
ncbi:MAG: glutamine-hydrolyzing GMP synthase [Flavobacteriaceae bacterium]|nr:glutamine-hydrolyzing GMP synthase [Flavobacteriaceae bacterium]MCY4216800.1 glutamine-hydrolyzing GMP synthase [Flavobacteriaceae bacterium]MCY4253873.1 glutamine-hydrolyzing GMP synthase [Flavobacteriaceae bacterium]